MLSLESKEVDLTMNWCKATYPSVPGLFEIFFKFYLLLLFPLDLPYGFHNDCAVYLQWLAESI